MLSGPVDLQSVEQLGFVVDRATCGRTLPLTMDLDAATHLDSAAVRLLHELVAGDPGVELVAGEQSVAARVLRVVGLQHHSRAVGTPEQV